MNNNDKKLDAIAELLETVSHLSDIEIVALSKAIEEKLNINKKEKP